MNTQADKPKRSAWKILFRHLEKHKRTIITISMLGIVSALANGTVPYIVGLFLDALIDLSKTFTFSEWVVPAWLAVLLLWIFVQLVANVVDWVIRRRSSVMRFAIQMGYQNNAFSHLLSLPISFHKNEKIGELSDFLSRTSFQLGGIVNTVLANLTPPLLSVVVGIVITWTIEPLFTFVLLVGVSIYTVVIIRLIVPMENTLEKGHEKWTNAYADALQAVTNITAVKHMAAEEYERKKIETSFMDEAFGWWEKMQLFYSNTTFFQRMIVLATQASIFFLSVYFIQQGEITIGQLVALNGYAALLFGPFVTFGNWWQVLQDGLVNIRRAEVRIFDAVPETYQPEEAFVPGNMTGKVEFNNVSFAYEVDTAVLKDVTFAAQPGERIAFVGKSGVGKSTAIELISGYYFPTEGAVRIDGHDTNAWDLTALRRNIAVVPQEVTLFNDTIMANIRYGRLEASDEEVVEAAKQAHAHEFIEKFPKQYGQIVGERGIKLSVGQKQRVAIARAILRDPKILILDEPTSALDAHTEQLITESLERLMEGRTTFIIAHRLSTVRRADRILVFEAGQIVEQGTHDELIQKENGVYRGLHEYQVGLH